MHPFTGNVTQRLVDHALAVEAGFIGKGGRFDHDGEVGFAAAIIARMACMLGAVVYYLESRRVEGFGQKALHFLLHWFWHEFESPLEGFLTGFAPPF
jgi:hypothetical protein